MRVEKDCIIIDDPTIIDFLKRHDSPEMMDAVKNLMTCICLMHDPDHNSPEELITTNENFIKYSHLICDLSKDVV